MNTPKVGDIGQKEFREIISDAPVGVNLTLQDMIRSTVEQIESFTRGWEGEGIEDLQI